MSLTDYQEKLKEQVIALLSSEDEYNRSYFLAQVEEIYKKSKDNFFSQLLELFVHLQFKEDEAIQHWRKLIEQSCILSEALNRDIGLRVAMLDYFFNLNKLLSNPMLIEIHVFKQTEKMAMIDGLTGIFNRRYMDIALKKEFNRSFRYNKELSIIILDIDNFKILNDTRGHMFGDTVLRELSDFLKKLVREEDILCRYGGEEFLIILPETSIQGSLIFAERIKGKMHEINFFNKNSITVSGGVSNYPYSGKTISDLLNGADRALYQAKFSGKDQMAACDEDRRKFDRFDQAWCFSFSIASDEKDTKKSKEILVHNVSLGGVRFQTNQRLELDTQLNLQIRLTEKNSAPITIPGKVIWARKTEEDGFTYGVVFQDLTAAQIERLKICLPASYLYTF
jgi:diguanylate cyclase (GGDEF)-like protein